MPSKRRSAARTSTRSTRRSAPVRIFQEDEDDSMIGADDDDDDDDAAAQSPAVEEQEAEEDADEELEDMGTPAQDSQDGEETATLSASQSRTRRAGRPAKHTRGTRPEDWGSPEADPEPAPEYISDTTTPKRGRGRGRPSRGGPRGRPGRPNRGPSHVTQVPIDKAGNMMDVVDDEVAMPEDPEGETKVDKDGVLQGDREYRVRTFKIAGRGDKLYMLSTEPARCTGFRDSYLFFAKHPTLYKIIIDDYEKKDLIDRELIPHSYKGRAIGVVTARSVFREFGCKIIVGGKKVTDDYNASEARARGDREGDLADPTDVVPAPGRTYNRNQYVAWHGASSVYHSSSAPSMPLGGKPNIMGTKRKANLTAENWLLEHALAASRYNSALLSSRKLTLGGVYDTHTNLVCFPGITQPTHARWQRMPLPEPPSKRRRLDTLKETAPHSKTNGDAALTNGIDTTHSSSPQPPNSQSKLFQPLSDVLVRNYLIVDTRFETPAHSSLPSPGPAAYSNYSPITNAAPGAPSLSEEDMDEMGLPEECRQALREVKRAENQWTKAWGDEHRDGCRGTMRIGVGT